MFWIGLAILIIAGWIIYSKRKGSVTLSRDQAQLVLQLARKEREKLAQEMQNTVDKGALEGKTISVDSVCKTTADMTEEVKQEVARRKLELLDKYGLTIPVNTAHRILWELDGNGQMWSDRPGCFERHLQRRDANLLFPQERRVVTHKEIEEARERDRIEQQRFGEKVKAFAEGIVNMREQNIPMERATSVLKEVQELLEEAASIGGDIAYPVEILKNTEEALLQSMGQTTPAGADLLKRGQSLSILKRLPYFAQFTRKDSPIPAEEEIPALLSEDLDAISFHGFVSRAFAPGYRPNEADIRSHLEKAISRGFSKERAARIINAWNEDRSKADEAN
jgi:hypothetical protein